MSDDLEQTRVSLATVFKVGAVVLTVTVSAVGALFELHALEKQAADYGARIDNLERNVLWRHE